MSTTTAAAPARQRKPRPRPERRIRVCIEPEGRSPGVVRIAVGSDRADYFLTELAADFGRGFLVEKVGADGRYNVNLEDDRRSCECKGHNRHGHCKHADGLAALVAAGRL